MSLFELIGIIAFAQWSVKFLTGANTVSHNHKGAINTMKHQAVIRNTLKTLGYTRKRSTNDFLSVASKKHKYANITVTNFGHRIIVMTSFHTDTDFLPEAFAVAKAIALRVGGAVTKNSLSKMILSRAFEIKIGA